MTQVKQASDEGDRILIERSRVERILQVLAKVSVGEFHLDEVALPVAANDEFGALEEMFSVFFQELAQASRRNAEYRKEMEATNLALEEKVKTIAMQRLAIQDLSTPIIELWEDIITLPIVGVVDTHRSAEMTERLLHRISSSRVKCVIVDLTGVGLVDTSTANHFIRMISAARFLGAYCVVTGISAEVAQVFTQLGVELHDVPTLRSLKDGFRQCLLHLKGRRTAPSL